MVLRRSGWVFDPRCVRRPFYYMSGANCLTSLFVLRHANYSLPYAIFQFGHEIRVARLHCFYVLLRWFGFDVERKVSADGSFHNDQMIFWLKQHFEDRTLAMPHTLYTDEEVGAELLSPDASGVLPSALDIAVMYTYPLCYVDEVLLPYLRQTVVLASSEALLQHCGIDTTRPLIMQVSRFDRWKNPWQVIDIYRDVKQQMPTAQVALVGAMEAADDVRASEVLEDVRHYAGDDPDIHLLSDPQLIQHEEVNAFQRYSNVILQRSTHEGFGLTVTEAMWKYQPVVGTSATGLRRQIVHEQNGYIADDTETSAMYTLKLLRDRALHQRLGKQAHQCVQDNFLFPTMVREYLMALFKALGRPLSDETAHAMPSLKGQLKQ